MGARSRDHGGGFVVLNIEQLEKLMTAVYVGHKSASLGCSVVTGGSIAVIILIVVFLFLAMSKGIL